MVSSSTLAASFCSRKEKMRGGDVVAWGDCCSSSEEGSSSGMKSAMVPPFTCHRVPQKIPHFPPASARGDPSPLPTLPPLPSSLVAAQRRRMLKTGQPTPVSVRRYLRGSGAHLDVHV